MTMLTLDLDTHVHVHTIIKEEINSYASSNPGFDPSSLLAVEDWITTSQTSGGLVEAFRSISSDPAGGLIIANILCARFRDLL